MRNMILPIIALFWIVVTIWLWRRDQSAKAERRSHADVLAGGLLFLLTLGFFWRTLSGDVYQPADGGDLVSFLFPTYRFAASQLSQWTVPLWNPHLYGGAPFISDIQAGFFYPPNLLLFLINPNFDYPTMQWLVFGHIYWAGLGLYVLLRSLKFGEVSISRPAAIFGAVAFQFSDPLLVHLGNLNLIAVLSWLPWVLTTHHVALARRSYRWASLTALLFAIAIYAGHAQSMFYIGLAIAIYTVIHTAIWGVWRVMDDPKNTTHEKALSSLNLSLCHFDLRLLSHPLRLFLTTTLLTFLLSAPIILPSIALTDYTERSQFTYQDTTAFSLAPTQAIGLLTPSFFGRGPALHWSLWDRIETPYAGVATLILAVMGLILASPKTKRQLWPWLGLALFGFITALGVYALLHGWLTATVPGFGQFRAPARALVLWTFGISILGAVGVMVVGRSMESRASTPSGSALATLFLKSGAVIFTVVMLPLLYLALLMTQNDPTIFLRTSIAALAITLTAGFWLSTGVLIYARQAQWLSQSTFATLMVMLLFLDLSSTGAYTDISPDDPTRGYDHAEIIHFLQGDPDQFRIDTRTDIADLWQPDTAALHNLQDIWGVANPLVLQHWSALWESLGGRQTALYDMLNVKYIIVRDGTPLPEGKFALALDAANELSVYRNLDFMQRAWLVHETVVVPSQQEALAAMQGDGFSPKEVVVFQGDGAMPTAPASGQEGVKITHYGSSDMEIQVKTSAPAYLVFSEVWYPGWRARVNEQPTEIRQANGSLRAIAVPTGESVVKMSFRPRGWTIGLGLFVVGLLAFLMINIINLKRVGRFRQ